MSEVSRYTLKKSGLDVYFDAIVISRDIGMRKPHPEIFNYALTNLGIKNRDAIHVGDSLEQDVQGAKNAGVKAIWVKGREENIHIKPDYTVNSLEEVPMLLEATELYK